jgi:cyclopropane fatty-acyl-phospholipid synthase-like methyltransferase
MRPYKDKFYGDRDAQTGHAARTILDLTLDLLPPVRSVVDVGCGVGTWLAVMRERGVGTIRGLDGAWVRRDLLTIPPESFVAVDLKERIPASERFDLAISVEVAEHLPPRCADTFADSLVNLSDFVLFSAAIPHQGGKHHLNEQWQDYWAGLFEDRGYASLDAIRPKIWEDEKIAFWYRQNVLLYVKKARLGALNLPGAASEASPRFPLRVVHPDQYLRKIPDSAGAGWKMFRRGITASLRRQAAGD